MFIMLKRYGLCKKKYVRAQKHKKKEREKKERKDSTYLKINDRVMQKEVRVPSRKITHKCTS